MKNTIAKSIEVEMCPSNDLSSVAADPNQIELCILNLSINARDAIMEKGLTRKDEDNGEKPRIIVRTENVILKVRSLGDNNGFERVTEERIPLTSIILVYIVLSLTGLC